MSVPRPARMLIRLPNWLGDVLLARRLLHALRRSLPDVPLFAVAPRPLLELLAPEGLFEQSHPWSRAGAGRRACMRAAREFGPDTTLVLPPSFSSAWFSWQTRARVRIGYAQEGRAPLLSHALERASRGAHHLSEEYLALGALLGVVEAPLPDLALATDAASAATELRGRHACLHGRGLALLGPGATYGPAKQWGADRFTELGRRLAAQGLGVAVCGTASEARLCDAIAMGVGAQAVSLAGRTELGALAGLCANATVAVCNDSGLAHLAAAAGTPTVALFGSTSSAWTAPLGRRVRIVQRAPVCAPCFRRTCRIGYACLRAIEVDLVERACAEIAA